MTALPPVPGSAEWLKLVTASKVAAILGVSPWDSPRKMWHTMRGELPPVVPTDAMERGNYLEAGVLSWWRDQHPEVVEYEEQFYATQDDMPWAAATPDALAKDSHGNTVVVDAKTTDSSDGWGEPGTDEVPIYYLAQVQWQMAMVPAAQFAYVPVLFGWPRLAFAEYVVERDEAVITSLIEKCSAFSASLHGDCPPDLDDTVATYEAIRALHPEIDAGVEVELTPEQAWEYLDAGDTAKAAVKRERAAKTVVLDAMGRAQYGVSEGLRVARRQPSKYGVSLNAVTKIRTVKESAV